MHDTHVDGARASALFGGWRRARAGRLVALTTRDAAATMDDDLMPSSLIVLRHDNMLGVQKSILVHPSDDIEEVRRRAFDAAYPGNDDMPLYAARLTLAPEAHHRH